MPYSTQGHSKILTLLSNIATKSIVLSQLSNSSLVSLGQLCDDYCSTTLNKKHLNAYKNIKLIMKGLRKNKDGLWDTPVQKKLCVITTT